MDNREKRKQGIGKTACGKRSSDYAWDLALANRILAERAATSFMKERMGNLTGFTKDDAESAAMEGLHEVFLDSGLSITAYRNRARAVMWRHMSHAYDMFSKETVPEGLTIGCLPSGDPNGIIDAKLLHRDLADAIAGLPGNLRLPFVLRTGFGRDDREMSYEEVALMLDIRNEDVLSACKKARERLRKLPALCEWKGSTCW